ncbi:hypothetical protein ACU8KH_00831 [Lachancea thermotolerans]
MYDIVTWLINIVTVYALFPYKRMSSRDHEVHSSASFSAERASGPRRLGTQREEATEGR